MPKTTLRFLIFSLIGVFNTTFDIVLYVILSNVTHSILIANIISTSAALVVSYGLNSNITFKSRSWTAGKFAGFIIVTLFGLWVIQTGLIYGFTHLLSLAPAFRGLNLPLQTLIPKLLATGFTFLWNFVWYSKVIFRHSAPREAVVEALEKL